MKQALSDVHVFKFSYYGVFLHTLTLFWPSRLKFCSFMMRRPRDTKPILTYKLSLFNFHIKRWQIEIKSINFIRRKIRLNVLVMNFLSLLPEFPYLLSNCEYEICIKLPKFQFIIS